MADFGLLILFLAALCSVEVMLMSGVGGAVGSASKLDDEVQDAASLAGMASRWRMSGDSVLGWSRSDQKGRFRSGPRGDGAPTTGADIWRAAIMDGVLLCSNSGTAAFDGGALGYNGCKCGGKGGCQTVSTTGGKDDPAFFGPGPFVGVDDSLVLLDGGWYSGEIYEIGGGGVQIGDDGGGVCGVSLATSAWALWASFWSVSITCWAWVGWALRFKGWADFVQGVFTAMEGSVECNGSLSTNVSV